MLKKGIFTVSSNVGNSYKGRGTGSSSSNSINTQAPFWTPSQSSDPGEVNRRHMYMTEPLLHVHVHVMIHVYNYITITYHLSER